MMVQSFHYMLGCIMLWLVVKVIYSTQMIAAPLSVCYLEVLLVWGHYPATSRELQPLKVENIIFI